MGIKSLLPKICLIIDKGGEHREYVSYPGDQLSISSLQQEYSMATVRKEQTFCSSHMKVVCCFWDMGRSQEDHGNGSQSNSDLCMCPVQFHSFPTLLAAP